MSVLFTDATEKAARAIILRCREEQIAWCPSQGDAESIAEAALSTALTHILEQGPSEDVIAAGNIAGYCGSIHGKSPEVFKAMIAALLREGG